MQRTILLFCFALIIVSSCRQKPTNKERFDYFVIVSLQTRDLPHQIKLFLNQLDQAQGQILSNPNTDRSMEIDQLKHSLFEITKSLDNRLQVLQKLRTPPGDGNLKSRATNLLKSTREMLVFEMPKVIAKLGSTPDPVLLLEGKPSFKIRYIKITMDQEMMSVNSQLYKDAYKLKASELEKYGL